MWILVECPPSPPSLSVNFFECMCKITWGVHSKYIEFRWFLQSYRLFWCYLFSRFRITIEENQHMIEYSYQLVIALFVKYTFLAIIWVVIHISTISSSEVIELWNFDRIFGPKLGYFCTRKIDWGVHAPKQLRRVPRRARASLTALPPSGSETAEMAQCFLNYQGYMHINPVWIKNTWKGRAEVVKCPGDRKSTAPTGHLVVL